MMRENLAFLAFLVASVSVFAQQDVQQATRLPVIRLCHEDVNYLPWQSIDGQGLDNILLDMAAAKSGVRIDVLPRPWKRCLSEMAEGELAGGFAISHNAERAEYAAFPTRADGKPDLSRRMRMDSYSLYRLKGTNIRWNGRKFVGLTGPVGAQLGYSVISDLEQRGASVDVAGGGAEQQFRKLVAGHIQLAALLTFVGDDLMLRPEFAGKVERIKPPFIEKPYFLVFGKSFQKAHPKVADDLWAAVAAVRESKTFRAMVRERFGPQVDIRP